MNLQLLMQKIPKPVLVLIALIGALALIVVSNPLKDECEVKTNLFLKEMRGIITSVRVKKSKTQYAQLTFWRDRCKEGNSIGSCEDYFSGLKKLALALAVFPDHCQTKFIEENEAFLKNVSDALQIMSLVAWGEKPPTGPSERLGWLTEDHLKTFCRLRKNFVALTSDEDLQALRDRIYFQYPDAWPEAIPMEDRKPEDRPKALKTASNPNGSFDKNKIFERSLFSIRCDLYQ